MESSTKKNKKTLRKKTGQNYVAYPDAETEIAMYYGFNPVEPPPASKENGKLLKSIVATETELHESEILTSVREKIAVLQNYEEKKLGAGPQPVMIYYREKVPTGGKKKSGTGTYRHNLEIVNSSKSIAEATLIQTAVEMFREKGLKNIYVDINSIGDKESANKFQREIALYYRKHLSELSSRCRQIIKKDIFAAVSCNEEKCSKLADEAPKSIAYLSERSSLHFKEVLEYLETLSIPYRINHRLLGNSNFITDTVFEISSIDEDEKNPGAPPLAYGFRYNSLGKKIGLKRDLPAVGITLKLKRDNKEENHRVRKPKLFFVQIGFEAKLKSLKVIAMLRQAKIPLYQALSRDKMESQLGIAENMKIPYVLIMGQREAMEDTVIVRNMINRSQETVPINNLAGYLKKLVG